MQCINILRIIAQIFKLNLVCFHQAGYILLGLRLFALNVLLPPTTGHKYRTDISIKFWIIFY